tara:strand:- start:67 stop:696 length:630 start_codon:yes stop_codon:yes gene_type:complete
MTLSEIKKSLVNIFQGKLKNIVSLADDSTLEKDMKVLKVGENNTAIHLADDKVNISGTLYYKNKEVLNYSYQNKVVNYYASATGNFIPLSGYVVERTSIAGQNDYVSMVAPYNGTLEKILWRSEIAQDGTIEMDIYESSDGTEVPGTIIGTKDTIVDIADDNTQEVLFSSMTTGTNYLKKGRIYAIKITTPSASNDTNNAVVFKWDVSS